MCRRGRQRFKMESEKFYQLLAPAIILSGAFLIFLLLLILAIAQWIKVVLARGWPVAAGIVLESHVAESRDSHGSYRQRAVINYRYEAGGQSFTNNVLAFGSRSLSEGGASAEKRAHEAVARYPVGRSVPVHYNPKHPEQSVLEIRSVLAKWLTLAAVIFLAAGVLAAGVVLIVNLAG